MENTYQDILTDVVNDHESGASVVAQKVIKCVELFAREQAEQPLAQFIEAVEDIAGQVLRAQPGMAQLTNFFNLIFVTIENETSESTLSLSRKLAGEAKRFDERSKNALGKVADIGAGLIDDDAVVLVHSNSSNVFQIVKKACEEGKTFEAVCLESRPVNEGRVCAAELSKLGVPSLYVVDAAASKGVERADLVLLGSDSLSENSLVNKVGSKAICLLAREDVVPCYAVGESNKFTPQRLRPKKEQPRNPAEVWDNPPAESTIENYYFDDIPLDLFTGIITEDGVLTPDEIQGKIRSQSLSTKLIELLK